MGNGIYNRDPLARHSSSHLEPPDILVPHSDTNEGYQVHKKGQDLGFRITVRYEW